MKIIDLISWYLKALNGDHVQTLYCLYRGPLTQVVVAGFVNDRCRNQIRSPPLLLFIPDSPLPWELVPFLIEFRTNSGADGIHEKRLPYVGAGPQFLRFLHPLGFGVSAGDDGLLPRP